MADPIQNTGMKIAQQALEKQAEGSSATTTPKDEDVRRFQEAMSSSGKEQEPADTVQQIGDKVEVEPSGHQGLGDQILSGLEKLGKQREEHLAKINELVSGQGDEPMTVQDTLKLQYELMKMSHEQELTTKVADKSGQGIQTLLRNQ